MKINVNNYAKTEMSRILTDRICFIRTEKAALWLSLLQLSYSNGE